MERRYLVYIALCLILGSVLRFHNIGKYGLIGDEMYALLVANFVAQEGAEEHEAFRKPDSPYFTNIETHQPKNLSNFLTAVARRDNGSAALHSLSLHFWIKVFGLSDASLRGLSALFNLLLTAFLAFFIIRHFQNQKLALLSVFLASISPFFITFSQVARSYSMIFFMALLTTHFLLLALEKRKMAWPHLAYGVLALLLLMTHYSSFLVLLFHAIYVFIYHRKLSTIVQLAIVATIPTIGLILWLNSAGGQWAFHSIAQSKKVYLEQVQLFKDPFIQVTSMEATLAQIIKVFAMSFLPLEVVYEHLGGLRNWAFTLLHTILVLILIRSSRKAWEKLISILLLAVSMGFVLSQNHIAFLQASYTIVLTVYFLFEQKKNLLTSRNAIVWLYPFSFIALIAFAYMDGNTFRMIPRYSGFGYVFGIVLWAGVMLYHWNSKKLILRTLLGVQSILFLYYCSVSLLDHYEDDQIRYFHNLSEQRMENPYALIAKTIEENYANGDTVIFPSMSFKKSDPGFDMPEYSVQDAQYVNLYLRSIEPVIIQRVDTTESDRVFIKGKEGNEKLIFDFENGRYRY